MGIVFAKVDTPSAYAKTGKVIKDVGYGVRLRPVRAFLSGIDIELRQATLRTRPALQAATRAGIRFPPTAGSTRGGFRHRHTVHKPAVTGPFVIKRREMLHRLVVPDEQIPDLPLVRMAVLRRLHRMCQLRDQGQSRLLLHSENPRTLTFRSKNIRASGAVMRACQRMHNIGLSLLLRPIARLAAL